MFAVSTSLLTFYWRLAAYLGASAGTSFLLAELLRHGSRLKIDHPALMNALFTGTEIVGTLLLCVLGSVGAVWAAYGRNGRNRVAFGIGHLAVLFILIWLKAYGLWSLYD